MIPVLAGLVLILGLGIWFVLSHRPPSDLTGRVAERIEFPRGSVPTDSAGVPASDQPASRRPNPEEELPSGALETAGSEAPAPTAEPEEAPAPNEEPTINEAPAPHEEPTPAEVPAVNEEPTSTEAPASNEEPTSTEAPTSNEEPAPAEVPADIDVPAANEDPSPAEEPIPAEPEYRLEEVPLNSLSPSARFGKVYYHQEEALPFPTSNDWRDVETPGHLASRPRDADGNVFTFGLHMDGPELGPYSITFDLAGAYDSFSGWCILPENKARDNDSVQYSKYFQIYCDGVLVYTSDTMKRGVPSSSFTLDVRGVNTLTIQYPATEGPNDLAVLCDAVLTRNVPVNE